LITGFFEDGKRESIGESMRLAEVRLMDQAETSHPYYWSGFAVIGDGARQLVGTR
jgi:CHAT domain-containing protein